MKTNKLALLVGLCGLGGALSLQAEGVGTSVKIKVDTKVLTCIHVQGGCNISTANSITKPIRAKLADAVSLGTIETDTTKKLMMPLGKDDETLYSFAPADTKLGKVYLSFQRDRTGRLGEIIRINRLLEGQKPTQNNWINVGNILPSAGKFNAVEEFTITPGAVIEKGDESIDLTKFENV